MDFVVKITLASVFRDADPEPLLLPRRDHSFNKGRVELFQGGKGGVELGGDLRKCGPSWDPKLFYKKGA